MRNSYREYQKIDRRARVLLLALVTGFACFLTAAALLKYRIPGFIMPGALATALIYVLTITFKFSTIIYSDRIYITFWPFFKTSIQISAITKIQLVNYDVPGFGVRYDLPNSITYYKAAGNTGLSVTLADDKTIVIGTGKATEIKYYLEQIKLAALSAPN